MYRYGLIGKDISYSFSKTYFSKKFREEGIKDSSYENFDLSDITQFPNVIEETKGLRGLNVTIPYKESIIPYLYKIDKIAKKIGAVNTIKVTKKGNLKGYNTDYYGFMKSVNPFLKPYHNKALVLGTGGASKGVAFALKKLGISITYVSRNAQGGHMISYSALSQEVMKDHLIIINCTPLGTHPNILDCPDIPYDHLTSKHLLYDLIYNPEETEFLRRGREKGAETCNGLQMLYLQAEKSWKIWN
jgi:shikimate dehydrogenase